MRPALPTAAGAVSAVETLLIIVVSGQCHVGGGAKHVYVSTSPECKILLAADSSSSSPNVVCLLFVRVQVEKLQPNCYLTAT